MSTMHVRRSRRIAAATVAIIAALSLRTRAVQFPLFRCAGSDPRKSGTPDAKYWRLSADANVSFDYPDPTFPDRKVVYFPPAVSHTSLSYREEGLQHEPGDPLLDEAGKPFGGAQWEVCDWDGDGDWDLITQAGRWTQAGPAFRENTGTNEAPRYKAAARITCWGQQITLSAHEHSFAATVKEPSRYARKPTGRPRLVWPRLCRRCHGPATKRPARAIGRELAQATKRLGK